MNQHLRTAAILALLLGSPAATGQALAQEKTAERAFAAGGRVWMDLSAGDYTVRAGRNDRVYVRASAADAEAARAVKVNIETSGSEARIVTDGPHNNFRVTIEVPPQSDIQIRLSAGDLRVSGITGSKDISSWAGDVDIDVGRASDYGDVDAAVKAGDIRASAFRVDKSGLFRSFSWKGPGRYRLHVRLTAGNLRMYEGPPPAARGPQPPAAPRGPRS